MSLGSELKNGIANEALNLNGSRLSPLSTSQEPVDYHQNNDAARRVCQRHNLIFPVFVQVIANRVLKAFKLKQERNWFNKLTDEHHDSLESEATIDRASLAVNLQNASGKQRRLP